MKSNTLVYVGLLCAVFLVVSWTAEAGRASPGVVQGKPLEVQEKDYYGGGGGGSHCYHGCCGEGHWSRSGGCHCCASAEEAKAYALNAAKP